MAKKRKKITEGHISHTSTNTANIFTEIKNKSYETWTGDSIQERNKMATVERLRHAIHNEENTSMLWAPPAGMLYVYFTTLLNEHWAIYRTVGKDAEDYSEDFYRTYYDRNAERQEDGSYTTTSTGDTLNGFQYGLQTLLNFLHTRALAETSAEVAFFKQLLDMFNAYKKQIPPELNQTLDTFVKEYNENQINETTYNQLMYLMQNISQMSSGNINTILTQLEKEAEQDRVELNKFIEDQKTKDADWYAKYESAQKSKNQTYMYALLKSKLNSQGKDIKFSSTRELEPITAAIFKKLGTSTNFKNTIKALIAEKIQANQFNPTSFIGEVQAFIIEEMKKSMSTLLKNKNVDEFVKKFESKFTVNNIGSILKKMSEMSTNQLSSDVSILATKKYNDIKQMIIEQKENIANVFLALKNSKELDDVLQEIDLLDYRKQIYDYLDKIEAANKPASIKGQLTKLMRTQKIIDKVQATVDKPITSLTADQAVELVTDVKVNAGAWAELFSADNLINLGLSAFTPGQIANRKADIRFVISYYIQETAKQGKASKEQQKQLQTALNTFPQLLVNEQLQAMKELQGGSAAVNIEANVKGYNSAINKLREEIHDIFKDNTVLEQEVLSKLSTLLIGSISVKDYSMPSAKKGFDVGGVGGSLQQSMKNITDIYKFADININPNDLMLAAINIGADSIGSALYSSALEQIVLGAVMDLLMDDSFINISKYYNQIQADLAASATNSPGIHLFKLNTYLIPASYLYQMIAVALNEHANDFVLNTLPNRATNISVELYQPINTKSLPQVTTKTKEYNMADAKDRWEYISKKAQDSFHMRIHFAKGIIDTIQNLPDYLKQFNF